MIPGWILVIFSKGPLLLALPAVYWLLPESARWLMTQGRMKEARKEVLRAARVNGRTISEAMLSQRCTYHSAIPVVTQDGPGLFLVFTEVCHLFDERHVELNERSAKWSHMRNRQISDSFETFIIENKGQRGSDLLQLCVELYQCVPTQIR
ncbi:unnamed protein product [Arctogadus glacialis]